MDTVLNTFAAAISDPEVKAVVLNENIELTSTLTKAGEAQTVIAKSFVLDGNGKTLTYTGSDRAIDIRSEVENVTIKNLTLNLTSSYVERGINYNANGTLVLDGVQFTGTAPSYAVNFPGKADNSVVTINNCELTGLIALNVWGANMTINVSNSVLTSVDNSTAEGYAAVKLNNDGTTVADGSLINIKNSTVVATNQDGEPSCAIYNASETGEIVVAEDCEVVGKNKVQVAAVYYDNTDNFYGAVSLAEAIKLAVDTDAVGIRLTRSFEVNETVAIAKDQTILLDLNGKTISAELIKDAGAVINIAEGVSATLIGGTIKNIKANGDAAINNSGNLVLKDVTIEGAPLADGGYSAYAVISSGKMTIEEGTVISADRGSIKVTGDGETIINGGRFTNNDIGSRTLTSHVVDVEDGSTNKLTINGGTFQHLHATTSGGVVICNRTRGTVYVNGGNFSGGNYYGNDNLSDYGYGGTFSVKGGVFSAKPAAKYIAEGYKAISANGKYHVLPEVVADATETAGVTSVTESTADVATALATNNGEATMFMWNDVAYIANYGKVTITSSADEATTSRGVVESAAGLTSATVAEGIEVVGNRTFRKCANLETVELPNTLTEIGPAVFQSCSKLANVTIPASVTTIGEGAFAECTSLTSINIPNGITRLEKDVLRNTGLVSIEIPASVNYIGTYAFRDCESLTEVKILSPEFTIENNTFTNMAAPVPTMTIKVVNAEMKAYLDSVLTNYDKSYITVVVM